MGGGGCWLPLQTPSLHGLFVFSPLARADAVIFPRCERIDAVHAKPAGGSTRRRRSKISFLPLLPARFLRGNSGAARECVTQT